MAEITVFFMSLPALLLSAGLVKLCIHSDLM